MTSVVLHAAVSLYCLGVSWFVQVVRYPLSAAVGSEAWPAYHRAHRVRTGWVIGGPMLAQLGLGVLLVVRRPEGVGVAPVLLALALTMVIFALTFLLAVPDHDRLARGWDDPVGRQLVRVNAWRTGAWTAHAALSLALVTTLA